MNCIIIEDVENAVEHLENQLKYSGYEIEVLVRIDTVREAVHWLTENRTDLIFLDIQLGDGISFEIFDHVQVATPVIFTTSYDQFLARAFEVNSISYLLKPIDATQLKNALDKLNFLKEHADTLNDRMASFNQNYQKRFMVKNGNSFHPVPAEDVAWFYVENKHFLFITTSNKQQYLYDSTLEVLEQRLDPQQFFRINRQYIVAFNRIKKVTPLDDNRRLKVETEPACKDELIISRYRAAEFKAWLDR